MSQAPLRIVAFNNMPFAFNMTQQWAEKAGHKIVLTVTSPGPKNRRSNGYKEIAALAGDKNVELLTSTRIKSVVTPAVQALRPDLILSFTFPWLLPPELLASARLGAVNLHPAALPAYRGPNVLRQFYEGAPVIGATLHWTDDSFDTGRILSQHTAPLPVRITREAIFALWPGLMVRALAEGTARAIAGERGSEQDPARASYAAPFAPSEHILDWREPALVVQRKCVALNMLGPMALARIDGATWQVESAEALDETSTQLPGTVLTREETKLRIATGDGVVEITGKPSG